jgi:hypothetical protein
MIGRAYDYEHWNCATLVAERIGFSHEPGAEWGRAFTAALRRNGRQLPAPRNGCVVVMTNPDNSLHVGIVEGASVLHSDPIAGTCRTPLALLKREAKRMRFYEWLG